MRPHSFARAFPIAQRQVLEKERMSLESAKIEAEALLSELPAARGDAARYC